MAHALMSCSQILPPEIRGGVYILFLEFYGLAFHSETLHAPGSSCCKSEEGTESHCFHAGSEVPICGHSILSPLPGKFSWLLLHNHVFTEGVFVGCLLCSILRVGDTTMDETDRQTDRSLVLVGRQRQWTRTIFQTQKRARAELRCGLEVRRNRQRFPTHFLAPELLWGYPAFRLPVCRLPVLTCPLITVTSY